MTEEMREALECRSDNKRMGKSSWSCHHTPDCGWVLGKAYRSVVAERDALKEQVASENEDRISQVKRLVAEAEISIAAQTLLIQTLSRKLSATKGREEEALAGAGIAIVELRDDIIKEQAKHKQWLLAKTIYWVSICDRVVGILSSPVQVEPLCQTTTSKEWCNIGAQSLDRTPFGPDATRSPISCAEDVARLAVRITEAKFEDPGDAVRWSVVIHAYEDAAKAEPGETI